MSPNDLTRVLSRYLALELSGEAVEDWANLVECRDETTFPLSAGVDLREIIHELANPLLTRPLTGDTAAELVKAISAKRFLEESETNIRLA